VRGALGGGANSKAAGFLGGLADSLGIGEFADQFGGVENVLDGISTKAAVAATGAAALGAVLVKLGVDSFNTFKTVVEQVDAVADVTGSSAEEASKLVGVFKGVGIDATAGASAMAKLAKAVGTNEAGLLKYGIVVARNADGTANLNGTLLNVASAYQATTDPAERAALASAVFGKSWADMVDVLEKSRSKISELQGLAPGVTDDDIKEARGVQAGDRRVRAGVDRFEAGGRPAADLVDHRRTRTVHRGGERRRVDRDRRSGRGVGQTVQRHEAGVYGVPGRLRRSRRQDGRRSVASVIRCPQPRRRSRARISSCRSRRLGVRQPV
jgi:hypothetical protein